MKGLAQVNSERAAVMKVVDRKARKHYGFELSVAYNHLVNVQLDHRKRWDNYNARCPRVRFIKKGDPVTESQPFTRDFAIYSRVIWGQPNLILLEVFRDKD